MNRLTRSRRRPDLRAEAGFSLIELIAVMLILGIVLTGLTQLFTSGTNAEVDQTNRVQSQQAARTGFDRFRRESRCATSVTYNSTTSVSLSLPGYCTRTTLTSALTISTSGLSNAPISVSTLNGFASGANTISFANSSYHENVSCTGTAAGQFTGCSGAAEVTSQTYPAGTVVTATTPSTVTWCIPTSGRGSSSPYSLDRFVGACGAASSGTAWVTGLVSNAIFAETVMPAATTATASSGGTLTAGAYYYDVTAIVNGAEVPGTYVGPITFSGGAANEVTLSWSAFAVGATAASSYNVYGRDASGVRLLGNTTSLTYTDTGPTTLTADTTLPNATIPVASTAAFTVGPPYVIQFSASGPVSCTGKDATHFTGCSGGQSGTYASGDPVASYSTVRPPSIVLTVTLTANKTKGASSTTKQGQFLLTDNVTLRNSRQF